MRKKEGKKEGVKNKKSRLSLFALFALLLCRVSAFIVKIISISHCLSGASYHVKFKPPKNMKLGDDGKPVAESMLDDDTGEKLEQRKDDTASALVKRLKEYHGSTVPILKHYNPKGIVESVNANQGMDVVWGEILGALKGTKKN